MRHCLQEPAASRSNRGHLLGSRRRDGHHSRQHRRHQSGRNWHRHTRRGGQLDLTITEQFARSMSLDEAMSSDNLLCYEMNSEPLPAEHGAPVRLIAPGWYGVANVKWLTRIQLVDQRFAGRFMARDYVTVREILDNVGNTQWTFNTVSFDRLKSTPAKVTHRDGRHTIIGVAWGAPIAEVEVSIDAGPWVPPHSPIDLRGQTGRRATRGGCGPSTGGPPNLASTRSRRGPPMSKATSSRQPTTHGSLADAPTGRTTTKSPESSRFASSDHATGPARPLGARGLARGRPHPGEGSSSWRGVIEPLARRCLPLSRSPQWERLWGGADDGAGTTTIGGSCSS